MVRDSIGTPPIGQYCLGRLCFACCPGTPARGDNQRRDTHKTVLRNGLTL